METKKRFFATFGEVNAPMTRDWPYLAGMSEISQELTSHRKAVRTDLSTQRIPKHDSDTSLWDPFSVLFFGVIPTSFIPSNDFPFASTYFYLIENNEEWTFFEKKKPTFHHQRNFSCSLVRRRLDWDACSNSEKTSLNTQSHARSNFLEQNLG